ncbi:MAG: TerB family tellurite resistance protein [Myxococcota bacterium]
MLDQLNHQDRMRLMRFVCSFAWADLKVSGPERDFVHKLVRRLHLDPQEAQQVEGWLKSPPDEESVDPTSIPPEHKLMFLKAAEGVIKSDGRVSAEERESFNLLAQLIR